VNHLRVEYPVHFRRHGRGAVRAMQAGPPPTADPAPRLPRVARLMALAIRFDHLVRTGVVKDYATLAQLAKVSPARISQIMSLIHLSPAIQEMLLFLPPVQRGRAPVILADLQPLTAQADWAQQQRRWQAWGARRQRHLAR